MNPTSQASIPQATPLTKPLVKPLSEERERELLKDTTSYVYQSEDGVDCQAHCFLPKGHEFAQPKPVILFFHGGLWDKSMVTQFAPHAMHFASRGMVAVCAEYRVADKNNTTPEDAMEDAHMAVLWLKHNATELGIDPSLICVAGAASGAHMALSLAMHPETMEMDGINSRPHCVIGLSSLVNTTKKGIQHDKFADSKRAHKFSPSNLIKKKLPPMLLIHGKADTITPYDHVARFAKVMKRKKNDFELIDFEAMNHSFFNFNVSAQHFEIALNSMDAFLANHGYIEPMEYGE
ncbi:MAG: alpha/beta hydrolase [Akkermansiaceae bacterium]